MKLITQKKSKKLHQIDSMAALQSEWRSIQAAIQSRSKRLVIVIEGFDASGKGGVIRALTEFLDPRTYRVYPIGAPNETEKQQHYLQRFWQRLPQMGMISIFDRSWYGRVLVEKVEKLAPLKRINEAYDEINQFEKLLMDDDVLLLKFFLVVSKKEQLERFKDRLKDPLKNWKITEDDLKNRSHWGQYVQSVEKMLNLTQTSKKWNVIPSDNKAWTRHEVLKTICTELAHLKPEKQYAIEKKRAQKLIERLK